MAILWRLRISPPVCFVVGDYRRSYQEYGFTKRVFDRNIHVSRETMGNRWEYGSKVLSLSLNLVNCHSYSPMGNPTHLNSHSFAIAHMIPSQIETSSARRVNPQYCRALSRTLYVLTVHYRVSLASKTMTATDDSRSQCYSRNRCIWRPTYLAHARSERQLQHDRMFHVKLSKS